MMYQQVVARRYAKGLLLASKREELFKLEMELKSLVGLFAEEQSDFYRLFDDPAFFPSERKVVVNRIAQQSDMNMTLRYFLLLLVDKDRMTLLPLIYEAFVSLIDDSSGRLRANIESASPLDEKIIEDIKDALEKISRKHVLVSTSIVPELIGGIRVEMAGMIWDGSVKAKLDDFKSRLFYEVGTN